MKFNDNTTHIILCIIVILLVILILYSDVLFSSNNNKSNSSTISNSFNNSTTLQNQQQQPTSSPENATINNIIYYANTISNNLDNKDCNDLPNNIQYSNYPELQCNKNKNNEIDILNNQLSNYINVQSSNLNNTLSTNKSVLNSIAGDRQSYINRTYVQDFLDYQKRSLTPSPQSQSSKSELFGNVPTVPTIDNFDNELILYPMKPGDFYGMYKISPSQFVLLDGLKFHFDYQYIIIYDKDESILCQYQNDTITVIQFNKMPTTTIKITLKDTSILNSNSTSSSSTTSQNNTILDKQNKISLLQNLGLSSGDVYLHGNDGSYHLYNYYKTLIFKLERLTQE